MVTSAADLVVRNIGVLVTPVPRSDAALAGADQGRVRTVRRAAVAIRAGRIVAVGPESSVARRFQARRTLDANGGLVTPGLVDAHTHLVFAGDRSGEWVRRCQGASYQEIATAGGGILTTVRATRRASEDSLYEAALGRLRAAVAMGTTTVEVKSGYGLSVAAEVRSLRAIRRLGRWVPGVRVVPTFLGAHEVPPEYRERREAYLDLVCGPMLDAVVREGLATYCDVFCEPGVFSVEESRRVLDSAKARGLGLRVHAEEFERSGGARLAAEMGAASADHLVAVDGDGIAALAAAGTVAVLLPATSVHLGTFRFAPARAMVEAGVPVALGTDCNPGSSMTWSMPLVLSLACLGPRLTPEEALVAATHNAAASLGLGNETGSLVPGRSADLVVWDAPTLAALPYRLGSDLARSVVVAGAVKAGCLPSR